MSRPFLPAKVRRKSIGLTLSPLARKKGHQAARKEGCSFSAIVDKLLLSLKS